MFAILAFELLGEHFSLFDAALSNTGSGVSQVGHEGLEQILHEYAFIKGKAKVSNEAEYSLSHSPLAIPGQIVDEGKNVLREEIVTQYLGNLSEIDDDVEAIDIDDGSDDMW